jgi:hypothetical protein
MTRIPERQAPVNPQITLGTIPAMAEASLAIEEVCRWWA